jgi:hypothetical protein
VEYRSVRCHLFSPISIEASRRLAVDGITANAVMPEAFASIYNGT